LIGQFGEIQIHEELYIDMAVHKTSSARTQQSNSPARSLPSSGKIAQKRWKVVISRVGRHAQTI